VSRTTLLLLRLSVFVLACLFLYLRLSRQQEGLDSAAMLAAIREPRAMLVLAVTGLLMLLNWGLESRKWRILVSDVEPISRWRAFWATLAGTPIGLITPNRVGEFVGRVLFLAPEHRIPASFATAVGSIAQFVITVVAGLLGLIALLFSAEHDRLSPAAAAWVGLCALVVAATVLLYFNPDLLRGAIARLPVVRRWERHAAVLDRFSHRMLLRVLMLSAARYAVFTLQFALLLGALADVPMLEAVAAIPSVFLVSTLIPTVMLTELGVRGSVAVALISPGIAHDHKIFLASTVLWVINLGLPAIAGGVILLAARIRSAQE
jgi:hypothetical protein